MWDFKQNLPIVQKRPRSSATIRIKMLSCLQASGTRALITSVAMDSTLRAAARFAAGFPTSKSLCHNHCVKRLIFVNRIREMVHLCFCGCFSSFTSMKQRKNSESSWGIESQTFGFRTLMLWHWAIETLRCAKPILKVIYGTCPAYC